MKGVFSSEKRIIWNKKGVLQKNMLFQDRGFRDQGDAVGHGDGRSLRRSFVWSEPRS